MTRRDGELFQAETVLPVQFFPLSQHATANTGEYRLAAAVLEDAIHCFQKYGCASDPHKQRLFREAHHWIMNENDQLPFSFEHICTVLSIDPAYVRRGLRCWQELQATPRADADIRTVGDAAR